MVISTYSRKMRGESGMSVRLIYGRSGSGKTEYCLGEIKERLMADQEGPPVIYLVPEQMTFLSEYRITTMPEIGGMIRAQVFSFPRLAWRVLQETGGFTRYHLNSVGISMLIRKIIEDQKEQLKLFQRAAEKNGFVQQMEQMLTEFKRYCIKPEELRQKQEQIAQTNTEEKKVIQEKLHDLELIYEHFERALFGKYTDTDDYYRLLSEKISQSSYLSNAEVFIDGFHTFTPLEYSVIAQLLKHCKRVTISLCVDELYEFTSPDELHLFRMTGETSRTIFQIIEDNRIEIEEPIHLGSQMRWKDPSLRHLDSQFDTRPASVYPRDTSIQLFQAVNRRAEIEGVARNILHLVRTKGYRFRDMAVLMRNGADYHDIIKTIFEDYQIPFYIDQKRTMLHHPLIEFVRSSLEVINGNWRYEAVFRTVKTDLLFPKGTAIVSMREKMDVLENYVLAYGIQGDKWTKRDRWTYRRFRGLEFDSPIQTDAEKRMEQELNDLRLLITAPILRFARRMKKADNGRKYCEALYLLLEELDIPAKLEKWKIAAEEQGKLVEAREHDQAWNSVIELLDQYVEILGEEKLTTKQFASILDAGIESMRFSLVPPAMDQVIVADLEKSRLGDVKVAFIIGLNEGVLPAKVSEEGILADDDRVRLLESGLKLAATSKLRLLDENFIAYKAFTTASERLVVSYPMANDEGKALMPSSYIKRLKDLFPKIELQSFVSGPDGLSETEQLEFVSSMNSTLSHLTAQLQQKKRGYPLYDFWWDVYNHYINSDGWKEIIKKVTASLFYENQAQRLSKEVSEELYGDHILTSVSRMELFHSCPFSHFSQYGLRLRERQIYRLEAPDIGDLFHAALKSIAETVMNENLSWANLTKQQSEQLARDAVEKLAPKLQNQILLSSNRHYYIKRKLENIISRASQVLTEHAKASGFAPVGLEVAFGPDAKLPPLTFTLKNGAKMELMGRIDRVDQAKDNHGVFLRIIDYKSSAKDLNFTEVYHGLALQMLTYLDVVISQSQSLIGSDAMPAGVLYFHVHNPIVQSSSILTMDEIEQAILKQVKMNGLMLSDPGVIRLMDGTLESGDSQIVSAGIKKDGSLSKKSKVATNEEFDLLRQYMRKTYTRAGNDIISGDAAISPFKMKDKTPCTYCSFKPVCQFDPSMDKNEYRILHSQKKEEIIDLLRKAGEDNE